MCERVLPFGINPLPVTLRKKDVKDQIRELGGTLEYLLDIIDPREEDDDGRVLTLKPKTRANNHLFTELGTVLFAIDVRNAITHPDDRPMPSGGDLQRARNKLNRAINEILNRVEPEIKDALLRDPHGYEPTMPLDEIEKVPDARRKLHLLFEALSNLLAKIDADEGFPTYSMINDDFVSTAQRLGRHHARFRNLNTAAVEEAIELAIRLSDHPHEDVTYAKLLDACMYLSQAVRQLNTTTSRTNQNELDNYTSIKPDSSQTSPKMDTLRNGDSIVRIPLWTDFRISIRTRTLVRFTLTGWTVAAILAILVFIVRSPNHHHLTTQKTQLDLREASVKSRENALSRERTEFHETQNVQRLELDKELANRRSKHEHDLSKLKADVVADLDKKRKANDAALETKRLIFKNEQSRVRDELDLRERKLSAAKDALKELRMEIATISPNEKTARLARLTEITGHLSASENRIKELEAESKTNQSLLARNDFEKQLLTKRIEDAQSEAAMWFKTADQLATCLFPERTWNRLTDAEQSLLLDRAWRSQIKLGAYRNNPYFSTTDAIEESKKYKPVRKKSWENNYQSNFSDECLAYLGLTPNIADTRAYQLFRTLVIEKAWFANNTKAQIGYWTDIDAFPNRKTYPDETNTAATTIQTRLDTKLKFDTINALIADRDKLDKRKQELAKERIELVKLRDQIRNLSSSEQTDLLTHLTSENSRLSEHEERIKELENELTKKRLEAQGWKTTAKKLGDYLCPEKSWDKIDQSGKKLLIESTWNTRISFACAPDRKSFILGKSKEWPKFWDAIKEHWTSQKKQVISAKHLRDLSLTPEEIQEKSKYIFVTFLMEKAWNWNNPVKKKSTRFSK